MRRRDAWRLLRWGVKSVGGLAANLALLTLWVDGLGFAAWWAVGINWLVVSIAGFVVTDRWVFGAAPSPEGWWNTVKQYAGMQTAMLSSKALNYVVYVTLLSVGIDYRLSWATGAAIAFGLSFAGNRWIWTSGVPERG